MSRTFLDGDAHDSCFYYLAKKCAAWFWAVTRFPLQAFDSILLYNGLAGMSRTFLQVCGLPISMIVLACIADRCGAGHPKTRPAHSTFHFYIEPLGRNVQQFVCLIIFCATRTSAYVLRSFLRSTT